MVSLPSPAVEAVYKVVTAAELEASIATILVRSTATEVLAIILFNSTAVADISETTKENLLREVLVALLTTIALKLAMEVAATDACIYAAFTVLSAEA